MARDKTSRKDEAFGRQIRKNSGTALRSEMVSPETAGQEELTSYTEVFPLEDNFGETNMRSTRGGRHGSTNSGRGRDQG